MTTALPLSVLESYAECPLRGRYVLWGAPEGAPTIDELFVLALRHATGAFLDMLGYRKMPKGRAHAEAVHAFKRYLQPHAERLKKDGFDFMRRMQHGMVMLERLSLELDLSRHAPLGGNVPATVDIDGYSVQGTITGLVFANMTMRRAHERLVVVQVGEAVRRPTPAQRLRMGFETTWVEENLRDYCQASRQRLVLEVKSGEIRWLDPLPQEAKGFRLLAKPFLHGIAENLFPPQSGPSCTRCPYEAACDLQLAAPEPSDFLRRRFLREVSECVS